MRVYEHYDEEGRVCAFEVSCLVGRRRAFRLVRRVPGARLTLSPKLFSWFRQDTFCEFELGGVSFFIEEPFGDNSRYWVGRRPFGWHPDFEKVVSVFREARLFGFRDR